MTCSSKKLKMYEYYFQFYRHKNLTGSYLVAEEIFQVKTNGSSRDVRQAGARKSSDKSFPPNSNRKTWKIPFP